MQRRHSTRPRAKLRIEALEARALMTAGVLDSEFGNGGLVTTVVGKVPAASAWAVAIQSDGKIVTAGSANMGSTTKTNLDMAIVRYDAAGGLDASFGSGGKVTTSVGIGNDVANDVVVQSDGKIVAAGTSAGSNSDFAIVRYTSAGKLDTAFGNKGKVTTDFAIGRASGSSDNAVAAALQGDGKLVVVGTTCAAGALCPRDNDIALARYKSDGTLDSSFGTGGKEIGRHLDILAASAYTQVNDVSLLADGRLVVAGTARVGGASEANQLFTLVYAANGSLDSSFGGDGAVSLPLNVSPGAVANVTIPADGTILLATTSDNGTNAGVTLVHYDVQGNLDSAFGVGGVAQSNLPVTAKSVAVQVDGKFVVGGSKFDASGANVMAVARFLADGSVDGSFGSGGLGTSSAGFTGVAQDLAIYPQSGSPHDGQIVLAGGGNLAGSTAGFAVARFQGDVVSQAAAVDQVLAGFDDGQTANGHKSWRKSNGHV